MGIKLVISSLDNHHSPRNTWIIRDLDRTLLTSYTLFSNPEYWENRKEKNEATMWKLAEKLQSLIKRRKEFTFSHLPLLWTSLSSLVFPDTLGEREREKWQIQERKGEKQDLNERKIHTHTLYQDGGDGVLIQSKKTRNSISKSTLIFLHREELKLMFKRKVGRRKKFPVIHFNVIYKRM